MILTSNYGLKKPEGTDLVDVQDFNGNMDILDEEVKKCLTLTGDSQNNTTTFTSADSTTANAWTDVEQLASEEKHSSIFNKVSIMFKNVRYLYKSIENMENTKLSTADLLNKIYPVGSIYMSVKNTSPATFIGGTWVAWGTGRVPVGVNTSDANFKTVEKAGGSATQNLRAAVGAVDGDIGAVGYAGTGVIANLKYSYAIKGDVIDSNIAASRISHAAQVLQPDGTSPTTIQPYITCYMWKRTA